jgi:hypothetical protein
MQVSRFTDGSWVAHRLMFDGIKSRISVWASPQGILRAAERIDGHGRAYPVKRDSMLWGRIQVRCDWLHVSVQRNGPTPVARCGATAAHGSPWTL